MSRQNYRTTAFIELAVAAVLFITPLGQLLLGLAVTVFIGRMIWSYRPEDSAMEKKYKEKYCNEFKN